MLNWNRAINAGFLGAVVMTVFMIVLRTLGLTSMNLEAMLGSMVTSIPDFGSWGLGFLIHLIAGGLFGIVYGFLMESLRRTGWSVGVGIAVVHTVLSGLAMPLIGAMHPLVRTGQMPAPGMFASALGGTGVVLFIALHLLFGAIVGKYYVALSKTPKSRPAESPRRRPPSTVIHRS
jgi:hypothetical protein